MQPGRDRSRLIKSYHVAIKEKLNLKPDINLLGYVALHTLSRVYDEKIGSEDEQKEIKIRLDRALETKEIDNSSYINLLFDILVNNNTEKTSSDYPNLVKSLNELKLEMKIVYDLKIKQIYGEFDSYSQTLIRSVLMENNIEFQPSAISSSFKIVLYSENVPVIDRFFEIKNLSDKDDLLGELKTHNRNDFDKILSLKSLNDINKSLKSIIIDEKLFQLIKKNSGIHKFIIEKETKRCLKTLYSQLTSDGDTSPVTFSEVVTFNHGRNCRIDDVISLKVCPEVNGLIQTKEETRISEFYFSVKSSMTEPNFKAFEEMGDYQEKIYNLLFDKIWSISYKSKLDELLQAVLNASQFDLYLLNEVEKFIATKPVFPKEDELAAKFMMLYLYCQKSYKKVDLSSIKYMKLVADGLSSEPKLLSLKVEVRYLWCKSHISHRIYNGLDKVLSDIITLKEEIDKSPKDYYFSESHSSIDEINNLLSNLNYYIAEKFFGFEEYELSDMHFIKFKESTDRSDSFLEQYFSNKSTATQTQYEINAARIEHKPLFTDQNTVTGFQNALEFIVSNDMTNLLTKYDLYELLLAIKDSSINLSDFTPKYLKKLSENLKHLIETFYSSSQKHNQPISFTIRFHEIFNIALALVSDIDYFNLLKEDEPTFKKLFDLLEDIGEKLSTNKIYSDYLQQQEGHDLVVKYNLDDFHLGDDFELKKLEDLDTLIKVTEAIDYCHKENIIFELSYETFRNDNNNYLRLCYDKKSSTKEINPIKKQNISYLSELILSALSNRTKEFKEVNKDFMDELKLLTNPKKYMRHNITYILDSILSIRVNEQTNETSLHYASKLKQDNNIISIAKELLPNRSKRNLSMVNQDKKPLKIMENLMWKNIIEKKGDQILPNLDNIIQECQKIRLWDKAEFYSKALMELLVEREQYDNAIDRLLNTHLKILENISQERRKSIFDLFLEIFKGARKELFEKFLSKIETTKDNLLERRRFINDMETMFTYQKTNQNPMPQTSKFHKTLTYENQKLNDLNVIIESLEYEYNDIRDKIEQKIVKREQLNKDEQEGIYLWFVMARVFLDHYIKFILHEVCGKVTNDQKEIFYFEENFNALINKLHDQGIDIDRFSLSTLKNYYLDDCIGTAYFKKLDNTSLYTIIKPEGEITIPPRFSKEQLMKIAYDSIYLRLSNNDIQIDIDYKYIFDLLEEHKHVNVEGMVEETECKKDEQHGLSAVISQFLSYVKKNQSKAEYSTMPKYFPIIDYRKQFEFLDNKKFKVQTWNDIQKITETLYGEPNISEDLKKILDDCNTTYIHISEKFRKYIPDLKDKKEEKFAINASDLKAKYERLIKFRYNEKENSEATILKLYNATYNEDIKEYKKLPRDSAILQYLENENSEANILRRYNETYNEKIKEYKELPKDSERLKDIEKKIFKDSISQLLAQKENKTTSKLVLTEGIEKRFDDLRKKIEAFEIEEGDFNIIRKYPNILYLLGIKKLGTLRSEGIIDEIGNYQEIKEGKKLDDVSLKLIEKINATCVPAPTYKEIKDFINKSIKHFRINRFSFKAIFMKFMSNELKTQKESKINLIDEIKKLIGFNAKQQMNDSGVIYTLSGYENIVQPKYNDEKEPPEHIRFCIKKACNASNLEVKEQALKLKNKEFTAKQILESIGLINKTNGTLNLEHNFADDHYRTMTSILEKDRKSSIQKLLEKSGKCKKKLKTFLSLIHKNYNKIWYTLIFQTANDFKHKVLNLLISINHQKIGAFAKFELSNCRVSEVYEFYKLYTVEDCLEEVKALYSKLEEKKILEHGRVNKDYRSASDVIKEFSKIPSRDFDIFLSRKKGTSDISNIYKEFNVTDTMKSVIDFLKNIFSIVTDSEKSVEGSKESFDKDLERYTLAKEIINKQRINECDMTQCDMTQDERYENFNDKANILKHETLLTTCEMSKILEELKR